MRAERNIRLLDLHSLMMSMMFIIPVMVPFYRDRMGLGYSDFLIAEACFAASLLLCEVPSGWISDVWSRRRTMITGTLFNIAGFSLMMTAESLFGMIAAEMTLGVGISLISGTNSALLYDSLLSAGREGEYRRHEGRRMGMGLYSVAGASIAGGFAYPLHPLLPLALTVGAQVLALVVACLMVEPARHRRLPEKHPLADMMETMRYALRGHAEVGLIILFAAVMFSATKCIMWAQQPYYMALNLREELFGLLMAAGFVLGGFSSQMAHRLDGRVSNFHALIAVWAVAVAACIMAALWPGWGGIALLMIGGSCIYGMAQPRVSEAINRRVGSDRRATVLSTQSLMTSLLFIPLGLALGQVSDAHGIRAVLAAVALWLGLAGMCLAMWCLRARWIALVRRSRTSGPA